MHFICLSLKGGSPSYYYLTSYNHDSLLIALLAPRRWFVTGITKPHVPRFVFWCSSQRRHLPVCSPLRVCSLSVIVADQLYFRDRYIIDIYGVGRTRKIQGIAIRVPSNGIGTFFNPFVLSALLARDRYAEVENICSLHNDTPTS
jgi:hypothetical protein